MKKILCYGDSNTWGHDPVDCSRLDIRWTVMLKEMFPEYDITEDGVCGRSTHFDVPDTPNSNGIECFRERYIHNKSEFDLIIIMLATNDQLNYFDCTPRESARAVGDMVREYRAKYGNDTQFLIISPILIRSEVMEHPIFTELYCEKTIEQSKLFADAFKTEAESLGTHFLDAASAANASTIDGVHMDSSEHKKLANEIAKKVKEIL